MSWIKEEISHPKRPGWYAVACCWSPREGLLNGVSYWDGERWKKDGQNDDSPIVLFSNNPFPDEKSAGIWAEDNCLY